jgi:NAD(P)-dependent dehydrogenase (short-subunit alcohol dehydrogenase family)
VTYRDDREFAEVQRVAGTDVSRLTGRKADVTDEAAVQQLVDGIGAEYGQLDVLMNAVGGFAGGKNLWETETSVVDKMMALNLRSGLLLSRAAAKAMVTRGKGVILNVASKSAVDHEAGLPAYSASKAAALALMDSLAAELKGKGVRVNSLLPSIIDTEANRKAMPNADFAKWPKPEEIARVALFLCSDEATVIHGAAIPVYGNS